MDQMHEKLLDLYQRYFAILHEIHNAEKDIRSIRKEYKEILVDQVVDELYALFSQSDHVERKQIRSILNKMVDTFDYVYREWM